jgi:hypothetical protein
MDPQTSVSDKLKELNPNDAIFISTSIPVEGMSIEQLEVALAKKKADAEIATAMATLEDVLKVLKQHGIEPKVDWSLAG